MAGLDAHYARLQRLRRRSDRCWGAVRYIEDEPRMHLPDRKPVVDKHRRVPEEGTARGDRPHSHPSRLMILRCHSLRRVPRRADRGEPAPPPTRGAASATPLLQEHPQALSSHRLLGLDRVHRDSEHCHQPHLAPRLRKPEFAVDRFATASHRPNSAIQRPPEV